MKKNLFLCLLFLLGILNVSAQTTGNKGFKLNVNSGDAYLDCGDITQLNKAGAYTIEAWVNLKVVSEGVETKEELDIVEEFQPDYIQGYYFSYPLSLNDTLHYLQKRAARRT